MDFNNLISLQNRKILRGLLQETPRAKLFGIPEGFNNSIWWNVGHVMVTQQLLVYRLSGLTVELDPYWLDHFSKGTRPDGIDPGDERFEELNELLFSTIEKTEADLQSGRFDGFEEYMTSTKVPLRSATDAIAFNVYHEGLHLGSILALRRAQGLA